MHKIMKVVCLVHILFYYIFTANAVDIYFYGFSDCKKPIDDGEYKFEYTFNSESPKSMDVTMEIPDGITGDDLFHLDVHELNTDGEWDMYSKEIEGEICTYIDQFLLKAWEKITAQADPKIEGECSIPQGKFSWNNFQLESTDVVVPSGMIGRYKMDLSIIKDDVAVFCVGIEVETKQ